MKGRKQQFIQSYHGITLIALVITIIILLILAGVSISTITGDNGILSKAREAKEKTGQANAEEQVEIAVTGSIGTDGKINNKDLKTNLDQIENITGVPDEITDSSFPLTVKVDGYDVTIKKDGSVMLGEYVAPGNPDKTTGIFKETSTMNGKQGNKNNPVIPEGFKPVNVGEATWGDGTTEPLGINEGLVIEDGEGNQYVWVPVDGVLGDNGITVQNAVNGEVILGRYVFNYKGEINTTETPETLDGKITEFTSEGYVENSTGDGNTPAKDLEGFINSVRQNGGYYMARFEEPYSVKRRESPRVKIPARSVVVQLNLSDLIPFEQPCGWNIIGSTPLDICNFDKEEPFLLSAGDWVRHVPVTKDEYDRIRRDVENGTYKVKTYAAEENV